MEYRRANAYIISDREYCSCLRSVAKQFAIIVEGQEPKGEEKTGDHYEDQVYARPEDLHAPRRTQQLRDCIIGIFFQRSMLGVQII